MDILQKIKDKIIYYLHRRDHSEKELRQKLSKFEFEIHDIEKAINWAKERGYMSDPNRLSERHVERLQKKKKGIRYIQNYLQQKGLPPSPINDDQEYLNAKSLALQIAKKMKLSLDIEKLEREHKEKIGQKLLTRGFSMGIVRKIIYSNELN